LPVAERDRDIRNKLYARIRSDGKLDEREFGIFPLQI